MNTMNKTTVMSLIGTSLFIFIMVGSVSASTLDKGILSLVDEIVVGVKQKTMEKKYPTMPFKDQMRGKMMRERAANNFMQDVIQPEMMNRNREALKSEKITTIMNKKREDLPEKATAMVSR
ncbi:MAG: hypothetical protein D3923_14885 [Candidatus Electrothrix sp. AR3]|nr:hypothetical protein [Candidatus Electrothrix sp. AR3]